MKVVVSKEGIKLIKFKDLDKLNELYMDARFSLLNYEEMFQIRVVPYYSSSGELAAVEFSPRGTVFSLDNIQEIEIPEKVCRKFVVTFCYPERGKKIIRHFADSFMDLDPYDAILHAFGFIIEKSDGNEFTDDEVREVRDEVYSYWLHEFYESDWMLLSVYLDKKILFWFKKVETLFDSLKELEEMVKDVLLDPEVLFIDIEDTGIVYFVVLDSFYKDLFIFLLKISSFGNDPQEWKEEEVKAAVERFLELQKLRNFKAENVFFVFYEDLPPELSRDKKGLNEFSSKLGVKLMSFSDFIVYCSRKMSEEYYDAIAADEDSREIFKEILETFSPWFRIQDL